MPYEFSRLSDELGLVAQIDLQVGLQQFLGRRGKPIL
jgi:hypothetical protein